MQNYPKSTPKSMRNRYELHARKGDAKMVDNEHHLGPNSGEHVGVINFPVRFRCQDGTQTFIIFRNLATGSSGGVLGCPLTRFGILWALFGSLSGPFWSILAPFGPDSDSFSFTPSSCGASGFAPLFY